MTLEQTMRHSGETLLRIPGLPTKLKRDLRDLLGSEDIQENEQTERITRLLDLYQRATTIFAINPQLTHHSARHRDDHILLNKLAEQLQTLITELDFNGNAGEKLLDIRARLFTDLSPHTLLELTLDILHLIISATHSERKASEKFLDTVNHSLAQLLKNKQEIIDKSQTYFSTRADILKSMGELLSQGEIDIDNTIDSGQFKASAADAITQLRALLEHLTLSELKNKTLIDNLVYQQSQMQTLFTSTSDYRRRLAIQAKRLKKDPLTRVFNRKTFYEQLERAYQRWIKNREPLRIGLFDIDNFKVLNKEFGFSAGDKALKIIARTITNTIGDHGVVARFSGEEFIIIMNTDNDDQSQQLLKQTQSRISVLPFKFKEKRITITTSVVCCAFTDTDTPDDVLQRIYSQMSDIKNTGANQFSWL